MLKAIGQTEDGCRVVAGVFDFFATYGLPIDIIAMELKERGLIIGWDAFYEEAASASVGFRSIVTRMGEVMPSAERIDLLKELWAQVQDARNLLKK